MKSLERELLILMPDAGDDVAQKNEAKVINRLLDEMDSISHIIPVVEVFSLNHHKMIQKRKKVEKTLSKNSLPPFKFIIYKN